MHMAKYKIVLNSIFVAKELIYFKKGIEKVNNIFHNLKNKKNQHFCYCQLQT